MVRGQKIRPWMFKKEIIILYYGLKDKRTGIATKLPILLSVIYMLSPIDLVPDFIPVFGYLDDLIIVPLLLNLSIKMLPKEVLEESIAKSTRNLKKFQIFFIVMIILLIALLIGIGLFIRHLIISR
jgi:uncharacterized membrane protein YkvA (DUF1232 family)